MIDQRELSRHVLRCASAALPRGYDVAGIAPDSFAALLQHHEQTGRILVWDGASDRTIFGDARINFAFRAWHDACHIRGAHAFDARGEYGALQDMVRDVHRYIGDAQRTLALLRAEIVGQFNYAQLHRGAFPNDQLSFVRAYLDNPAAAIYGNY